MKELVNLKIKNCTIMSGGSESDIVPILREQRKMFDRCYKIEYDYGKKKLIEICSLFRVVYEIITRF